MKRIVSLVVLAVFVAAPAWAVEPVGSAASVFGTVWLQRGGKNYKLAQGTKLYNGDAVVTSADAYAKLLMVDESLLTVGAKSTFRIERYESNAGGRFASLRLFFGKVRAIVSKAAASRNDVRFVTPTAVAGVRGTHLVVEFDKSSQKTVVSVIEGSVGFKSLDQRTAGGEVVLGAKQRSEQSGGSSPSQPAPMSDAELSKLNKEIDKQTPGGDDQGGGEQSGGAGGGGNDAKPAGEGSGGGDDSGKPQGGDTEGRIEQNLDRVQTSTQSQPSTSDQNNPAVNPAADTGVRVRW